MRCLAFILAFSLACPLWAGRDQRQQQAGQVLQTDRLITIRIRMTAEQWRLMQPQHASRLAVALAVVQHPTTQQALDLADGRKPGKSSQKPPVEGTRRPPGLTGNEYAYVKAAVDIDGQRLQDVGVRFKGQWSYGMAAGSPRRPMSLNFDEFVPHQTFHGVKALGLSANAVDPSQLRESLAYEFFREAGLPAPRTCFALVYLSVDGLYNNELLGLYTAIEQVNKDFLHSRFGTSKGLLIRPERTRNLAYLGERWQNYDRYNLQSAATPFTASRFMNFTRLIHLADDETFCTDIANYIHVDQFLRFLAVNAMMINMDGILANGHNFYVYVHPKTGRISFVPWDLHYSFGAYGQTLEELAGLSIDQPYRVGNRLIERVMAIDSMRQTYLDYLRQFATGCFAPDKMHARIDELDKIVRKARYIAWFEGRELPITTYNASRFRPDLKPFVTARVHSVLEQLAGRVDGEPVGGRPQPPKPAPLRPVKPAPVVKTPPPAVKPAPVTPKPPLTLAARKTTAAALKAAAHAPAVAKPKPMPKVVKPVVAPKPKVLPLNPLAPFLVSILDSEHDGQLSRDEAADAVKHLYVAAARLRPGPLDEPLLAQTFDSIGTLLNPYPLAPDDPATPQDPLRPRPALTWARAITQHLDAGKPARFTLDDLLAAAGRLFDEADANNDGLLSYREVSALLDQLVPRQ